MKKVAIMQPYFFPYIGYFSLIKEVDRFILFDTVQFIRHGWIERNQILKPSDGIQYISVPLKKSPRETIIKDMCIRNDENWRERLLSQLVHYKKKGRFYIETIEVVKNSIEIETESITELNKRVLEKTCEYLKITTPIDIFSKMDLKIEKANKPDEWALNICKELKNVEEYWNPPGGKSFFEAKKYLNEGIDLKFHSVKIKEYDQKRTDFIPNLSIIDVMMFNSPEKINQMLGEYELI